MKSKILNNGATVESVLAILEENARQMEISRQEAEKQRQDYEKQRQETEKQRLEAEKQRLEAEKQRQKQSKKIDKQIEETFKAIKELGKNIGGISKSNGDFAEEYFFSAFEKGKQNFFGEKFDVIEKNVKGWKKGFRDEYDILLVNGKTVGIVEVKYNADKENLPRVLNKANTFRSNFPEYKKHKVYIGLASLVFDDKLEQDCIKKGIAVIKQVGKKVIINDKKMVAY